MMPRFGTACFPEWPSSAFTVVHVGATHSTEKLMDDRDHAGTLAFLEAHTTVHKTCRALHLRHQFLPLVAPAVGVTSDL